MSAPSYYFYTKEVDQPLPPLPLARGEPVGAALL
jgi:hypothetical protein